jgi:hypothetical protein
MAEVERRRSPRYPTDLSVRYRISSDAPWRNCHILDVSDDGATIQLQDIEPGESFGSRIDLEISSRPQDAIGVVLTAQIRRRSRQPDGLLIGVEFTSTGSDRVNLLRLLVGLRSVGADA